MSLDREVAGLTCRQVLERLSDYVDRELTGESRAVVEAHLRGCEECLRFGGAIGSMVAAIRGGLVAELPQGASQRLAAYLAASEHEA